MRYGSSADSLNPSFKSRMTDTKIATRKVVLSERDGTSNSRWIRNITLFLILVWLQESQGGEGGRRFLPPHKRDEGGNGPPNKLKIICTALVPFLLYTPTPAFLRSLSPSLSPFPSSSKQNFLHPDLSSRSLLTFPPEVT